MRFNGKNMEEVLQAHRRWYDEEDGARDEDRADFSGADLSGYVMCGLLLYGADFRGAKLTDAVLAHANLQRADLRDTITDGTDFYCAKLHGARIGNIPLACPDSGSFIAWKKAYLFDPETGEVGETVILKLLIPEDAERLSDTRNACWSSKAGCLEIQTIDGERLENRYAVAMWDRKFLYVVGETSVASGFNRDRFHHAHGKGIYWFTSRKNAVDYLDFRKFADEFKAKYTDLLKDKNMEERTNV